MGTNEKPIVTQLAKKLKVGPPQINSLISQLADSDSYARFIELIREYLPEYESEILAEGSEWGRIAAFVTRFADRYFPLEEVIEEYEYFVQTIPVLIQGVSYDDYHSITDWRTGYVLMTYLVEDPYESENRVVIAEECLEYASRELLQRVPQLGFAPGDLVRLTQGSRYEALGHWAQILWHDTGNFFLDTDYDWLWQDPLYWDRETVEALTRQWQQAERIQQMLFELAEWLEEDPPRHFEQILDFLEEKMNEQ